MLDTDETITGVEVEVADISTKMPPVLPINEGDVIDGDTQDNEEVAHAYTVTVVSSPSCARVVDTSCRASSTWSTTFMRKNAISSIAAVHSYSKSSKVDVLTS